MPIDVIKKPSTSQWQVVMGGKRLAGPFETKEEAEQEARKIQVALMGQPDRVDSPTTVDLERFRRTDRLKGMMNGRKPEVIRAEMATVTGRYKNGELLTHEYIEQIAELTAELNVALAAKEHGQLSIRDYETISTHLGNQFGINNSNFGLTKMFAALGNNEILPGQLPYRIELYANDAEHIIAAIARQRSNKPYEVRVLDPQAEHCPECLLYASMGLRPKGELPLPGDECTCNANCKCSLLQLTLEEAVQRGLD